jgi:eukaryotic-like serine/threonine-protein kinase
MSEVRRGEDTRLRRPVAVKLLRDDGNLRSIARFEQEAQILARLQHPNIVVVFDAGVDGDDRFIVMELVEGPTLRDLLDEEGRLAPRRAAGIASGVASALAFAHDRGVIHRDVKPANVLLPRGGGVKLADMGISQLLSPEALTATRTAIGTARYLSPEQARGDAVDGRSDLYSLGCVLFETLTGRTPFEGDLVALSYAHMHTPAPRVRSIDAEVPAGLDDLVASMLEKDPADRPQTGAEVERSLRAAPALAADVRVPSVEPTPSGPTLPLPPSVRAIPEQKTRRTAIMVLAGLVAVTVLLALLVKAGKNDRTGAAGGPADRSPASQQGSPTADVSTGSAEPLSLQQAAALVLEVASAQIPESDRTHIDEEIRAKIEEILRDDARGEDPERSLEKIAELRDKVAEAADKDEITPEARAAIDDALMKLADALSRTGD